MSLSLGELEKATHYSNHEELLQNNREDGLTHSLIKDNHMAQPMPPPPPPKQGLGMFGYLFMLALVVLVVGYFQGWFDVKKNPETGKWEVNTHAEKFKKDKDAMVKATSETYTSIKEKFTKKEADSKTAKPEDKAAHRQGNR